MTWKSITSQHDLEQAIQESFKNPVAIFKHSTSCSISHMAKLRVEDQWDQAKEEVVFYYLDLLNYRSISNLIAQRLHVHHESPQIILVKDGIAEYDASHFDISISELNETLDYHYG